jgi:hypothetical protein
MRQLFFETHPDFLIITAFIGFTVILTAASKHRNMLLLSGPAHKLL